jgi:hypothetical protein
MVGLTEITPTEGLEGIPHLDGLEGVSPLEGLEGISVQPFVGIRNMQLLIKWQTERLDKGNLHQPYFTFARVGVNDLAKIDCAREKKRQHIRMTHYTDTDLLIVKIPPAVHEKAHGTLATKSGSDSWEHGSTGL